MRKEQISWIKKHDYEVTDHGDGSVTLQGHQYDIHGCYWQIITITTSDFKEARDWMGF